MESLLSASVISIEITEISTIVSSFLIELYLVYLFNNCTIRSRSLFEVNEMEIFPFPFFVQDNSTGEEK